MENVEMSIEGKTLTIRIDLTKEFGRSASGKSIRVASSAGNKPVPGHDGMMIGLNVYRRA